MDPIFLLTLLVSLAALGAAGHGIWLAAAWVLRGFKPKSHRESPQQTIETDRLAATRYLNYLAKRGLLDEPQRQRIMEAIQQETAARQQGLAPPVIVPRPEATTRDALESIRALRSRDAEPTATAQRDESKAPSTAQRPDNRSDTTEKTTTEPTVDAVRDKTPVTPALLQPMSKSIAAAREAPPRPTVTAKPVEPRRPLSAVLASFMAEKNIRLGEIIGGLLIVSCSTALVISLWSQIESIPILKFLIFCGMTAAISGAGLFIYHRWKLPTTGRALLVIATMLVPLNLLAFAAFGKPGEIGSVWVIGSEVAAAALFAWLTLLAGRAVMPSMPKLFALGVIALGASTLLIRFASPATHPAVMMAVRCVPVALYLIVMGLSFRLWARRDDTDETHVRSLLLQLGVQSFAALVSVGFLIYQMGTITSALRNASPLLGAMAIPALLIGVHLWQSYRGALANGERITAATITLLAASMLLSCSVLAWPTPARLVPVIAVNAAAMATLARFTRRAEFHAAAAAWLAAGGVVLVHLAMGRIDWSLTESDTLVRAINSVVTGKVLIPVVAAAFGVAVWFERRDKRTMAVAYEFTALSMLAISVALVTIHGFARHGDPEQVTWVYLLYAVAAIAAARVLRFGVATWCGQQMLLLLGAAQWLVYTRPLEQFAWPTTLLAVGSVSACTVAVAAVFKRDRSHWIAACVTSATQFALFTSIVAVIWIFPPQSSGSLAAIGPRVAWAAVLWMILAAAAQSPMLMAAAQAALFVAAGVATHSHVSTQEWFADGGLWNPWVWQWHAVVAGSLCLVWAAMRIAIVRIGARLDMTAVAPSDDGSASTSPRFSIVQLGKRLLDPPIAAADHVGGIAVMIATLGLAVWALLPAVMAEHGKSLPTTIAEFHTLAAGWGSWLVTGVMLMLSLGRWLEHRRNDAVLCGIMCLWAAGVLGAARFEELHHASYAWRWIGAAICLVTSISIWVRHTFGAAARSAAGDGGASALPALDQSRWLIEALFFLPVIVLTEVSAEALAARVGVMALPDGDLSLRLWLLGPVMTLVVSLVALGQSKGLKKYGVAAGILACAAVSATEEALRVRAALVPDIDGVWLVQLNAIVLTAVFLTWHMLSRTRQHAGADRLTLPAWPLYIIRICLCIVLMLSVGKIVQSPGTLGVVVDQVGSVWSAIAIVLTEFAIHLVRRRNTIDDALRTTLWLFFGVVVGASSVSTLGWDSGNWECYHTLLVGFGLASILRLVIGQAEVRGYIGARWQETISAAAAVSTDTIGHDLSCITCGYNVRSLKLTAKCPECATSVLNTHCAALDRLKPEWSARLARLRSIISSTAKACIVLATILAIRGAFNDPQRPWWSAGMCLVMCGVATTFAVWQPHRGMSFVAGFELCLATSIAWIHFSGASTGPLSDIGWTDLMCVNLAALSAMAMGWIWAERKLLRPKLISTSDNHPSALHQFTAKTGVTTIALIATCALTTLVTGNAIISITPIVWTAWGAVVLLLLICAVTKEYADAWIGLYLTGLAGVILATSQFEPSQTTLVWMMSLEISGYALLAAAIWRWRTMVTPGSESLRRTNQWLPKLHMVLTIAASGLAAYAGYTNPQIGIRLLVATAPLLCAVGIFTLARSDASPRWLAGGIASLGLSVVLLSCSLLPHSAADDHFQRAMLVVAAMVITIVLAATVSAIATLRDTMRGAIRQAVICFAAIGGAGIGFVTYTNVQNLMHHSVATIEPAIRATMLAAMAVMIVALVSFALFHRADPWQAAEVYRGAHIYAAEIMAALLGLHVRATMPWLFSGFLSQFWPVIVMGLAFLAMAAGEILERKQLPVLAKPLGRTGLFLPALAMLDLFLAASNVHFTITLLTAGTFYAVVAALRRSPLFGLIASMHFTGALWYWLHRTESLDITRHPQLWFIPPALAVLAAGHFSRAQLTAAQRKSINYAGLIAIYVSSTADVFLIGVANAPWLPMVLGALSVAGILIGIGSRMLSFLQLGIGFLGVSLLTIIWHAAADLGWTWVWYVAGIGLGAMIITLFALFEKKRSEMTAVLREVREWQG